MEQGRPITSVERGNSLSSLVHDGIVRCRRQMQGEHYQCNWEERAAWVEKAWIHDRGPFGVSLVPEQQPEASNCQDCSSRRRPVPGLSPDGLKSCSPSNKDLLSFRTAIFKVVRSLWLIYLKPFKVVTMMPNTIIGSSKVSHHPILRSIEAA